MPAFISQTEREYIKQLGEALPGAAGAKWQAFLDFKLNLDVTKDLQDLQKDIAAKMQYFFTAYLHAEETLLKARVALINTHTESINSARGHPIAAIDAYNKTAKEKQHPILAYSFDRQGQIRVHYASDTDETSTMELPILEKLDYRKLATLKDAAHDAMIERIKAQIKPDINQDQIQTHADEQLDSAYRTYSKDIEAEYELHPFLRQEEAKTKRGFTRFYI